MSNVESKNKNYQVTRQALVLVIVIILLIAGSYSWLTFSKTSDKVNIIKSGDLSLELEEDTEILLQKAVPMSDARGIQTQKYIFRLKNEGSSPIKYDMFIDKIIPDQTEELQDKDVRYKLVNILIKRNSRKEINELFKKYSTDKSAIWLYSKVLYYKCGLIKMLKTML